MTISVDSYISLFDGECESTSRMISPNTYKSKLLMYITVEAREKLREEIKKKDRRKEIKKKGGKQ